MSRKIKKSLIFIGILFILTVVIAFMAITKPKTEALKTKPKIWVVNALRIAIDEISPVYPLLGKVESSSLVKAAAPVGGVIASIWVQEGGYFKKGQPLVSLAKEDLDLPVAIAEANLTSNKAKLDLYKLKAKTNKKNLKSELTLLKIKEKNVDRNTKLTKRKLSSEMILDKAKEELINQQKSVAMARLLVAEQDANLKQLQAAVQNAEINLQQTKINLTRGQLVAPFDGRVAKLLVAVGDRVNTGSGLINFYAVDDLELRVKIPQIYLSSIQQALKNGEQLFASYNSYASKEFKLPLLRLAGQSSASGLDAFLQIPASLDNITLGSIMQVNLVSAILPNVFAVPYSALYGFDKVFVIDEKTSQLVALQVQKLGKTANNKALLRANVKDGYLVLTTHLPNAITGLKVVVERENQ